LYSEITLHNLKRNKMSQASSGELVTMRYSVDRTNGIDGTWKTIVCEDNSDGGSDASVTEAKTKCGTFTTSSSATTNVNGSGVVDADPSSNQATFNDIHQLVLDKTLVWGRYQNLPDTANSVEAGDIVNIAGQGRFTSARSQNSAEDVSKFTWAFSFSGDVSVNPNS
jgi:hypothetical protein